MVLGPWWQKNGFSQKHVQDLVQILDRVLGLDPDQDLVQVLHQILDQLLDQVPDQVLHGPRAWTRSRTWTRSRPRIRSVFFFVKIIELELK